MLRPVDTGRDRFDRLGIVGPLLKGDVENNCAGSVFDQAIDELQTEYTKAVADSTYLPSDDFIERLSGYLAMADDRENPALS